MARVGRRGDNLVSGGFPSVSASSVMSQKGLWNHETTEYEAREWWRWGPTGSALGYEVGHRGHEALTWRLLARVVPTLRARQGAALAGSQDDGTERKTSPIYTFEWGFFFLNV
ncbi:hypothetical protein NL676_007049 [Syzygium grande]|nr:hypothetical protein NL676_007049 [Syzygium grande]